MAYGSHDDGGLAGLRLVVGGRQCRDDSLAACHTVYVLGEGVGRIAHALAVVGVQAYFHVVTRVEEHVALPEADKPVGRTCGGVYKKDEGQ